MPGNFDTSVTKVTLTWTMKWMCRLRLTMLWKNLPSIRAQTHKKVTLCCKFSSLQRRTKIAKLFYKRYQVKFASSQWRRTVHRIMFPGQFSESEYRNLAGEMLVQRSSLPSIWLIQQTRETTERGIAISRATRSTRFIRQGRNGVNSFFREYSAS